MNVSKIKLGVSIGLILSCFTFAVSAYIIDRTGGYYPIPAYVKCYSGFTTETVEAIQMSCLAWNMVHDGNLVYTSSSTHSRTTYPYENNANEITKGARGVNKYLMQTSYTNNNVHYIYEADIDINISYPFGTASTSYDTQSVMTHEIGHLLGLGHSGNASACMYATISPGQVKGVHQDDIAGINDIY